MKINVMTYNIHGGKDINDRLTLYGIANLIRENKADIVGLQEVDFHVNRSYFKNEIKYLSKKLGMYYAYGPNIRLGFGSFGNGILSRYKIKENKNYHLYSKGERRGLLTSLIELYGEKLCFMTAHLGLNSDERVKQVEDIIKAMENFKGNIILTGDFNETPSGKAYSILKDTLIDAIYSSKSDYFSYMDGDKPVRIDYIMHSRDIMAESIKAIKTDLSDHFPVITSLTI
ncbi:endonuclease/exonuclease/phosphatase family protein [Thermoanaerobacterium sp. RBIITD]|uniref:endonuclease/exonuclease/phosphatase family protein n=1 Tax=Thermoanaerobacterium sp. RBIITD TaxID=1550240 RepID=UPI000BB94908|nr:endonuclease/exonuclease/phosphatase family protein [Thermoanaerobacterium sp. RBIITD]SNX54539.1 Metal-dependent hydrolase, endonuclease/exonuclease/phosphatase family [Thermoanaerobacterium sp. RBIITD]